MNTLKKIAILDVYSLLYRAFFAIPLLSYNNTPINAVFGFIKILLKIYKDFKVDYLISCIDKGRSGRSVVYSQYKSQRKQTTDLFKQQIPIIYEFYNSSDLKLFYKEGFEADDVINTILNYLVNKKINENHFVFIITGDNDLLQLIDKNIYVITLKKGISEYIVYDKQKFYQEFGFDSKFYLLYKVLVGDSSDNVKGLQGIGPKKAKNFITTYLQENNFNIQDFSNFDESLIDTISNLLLNLYKLNLSKEKIKEVLKTNYDLMKLKIISDLEEIDLEKTKVINFINKGFIDFLKKYNFKSILEDINEELIQPKLKAMSVKNLDKNNDENLLNNNLSNNENEAKTKQLRLF